MKSIYRFYVVFLSLFSFILSQDSIQSIIDSAEDGSTVDVPSGTYAESISISKSINLTCEEGDCIINASGLPYGVSITANDVTVDGFEIIGDDLTISGVTIADSQNISVLNNQIHWYHYIHLHNLKSYHHYIHQYNLLLRHLHIHLHNLILNCHPIHQHNQGVFEFHRYIILNLLPHHQEH